jgi:hypothetical protein
MPNLNLNLLSSGNSVFQGYFRSGAVHRAEDYSRQQGNLFSRIFSGAHADRRSLNILKSVVPVL